jgi:hypothetical protein
MLRICPIQVFCWARFLAQQRVLRRSLHEGFAEILDTTLRPSSVAPQIFSRECSNTKRRQQLGTACTFTGAGHGPVLPCNIAATEDKDAVRRHTPQGGKDQALQAKSCLDDLSLAEKPWQTEPYEGL